MRVSAFGSLVSIVSLILAPDFGFAKARPRPEPMLKLTPVCEEGAGQYRWKIENDSEKAHNFRLYTEDGAGISFRGQIGAKSNLSVITLRKSNRTEGAENWTLQSEKFRTSSLRSLSSCESLGSGGGGQVECPPPAPTPDPVVCPPIPEPVVCPEPPPAPAVPAKHPCLDPSSPYYDVDPLTVAVKVHTDLLDNAKTFTFLQDVTFTLETCDSITLYGKLTQSLARAQLKVDSKLYLSPEILFGAQRISLIASDGSTLFQNLCSSTECYLGQFLYADLQGQFGLSTGSQYLIVVDYLIDGVPSQRAAVFSTY